MIADPALTAVTADLRSPRFRLGESRGLWRVIENAFPILIVAVAAQDAAAAAREWVFRLELGGFPALPPEVRIWDLERNALLAPNLRPTGNRRVTEAFKAWGGETVYRPWDRMARPHFASSSQPPAITNLYWSPSKDLTFILEDLHELLNLNARPSGIRTAS